MSSITKKFISTFLRDSSSVTRHFQIIPLQEVKVIEIQEPQEAYVAINIDSYTVEEQLILYKVKVIKEVSGCPNVVIDIE